MHLNHFEVGFKNKILIFSFKFEVFTIALTDNVLAYVTNLFIIEEYRGKGFSKELLQKMVLHQEIAEIELWFLTTKDSQIIYEKSNLP